MDGAAGCDVDFGGGGGGGGGGVDDGTRCSSGAVISSKVRMAGQASEADSRPRVDEFASPGDDRMPSPIVLGGPSKEARKASSARTA